MKRILELKCCLGSGIFTAAVKRGIAPHTRKQRVLAAISKLRSAFFTGYKNKTCEYCNWRASEASETLSGLFNRESWIYILLVSERSERDTLRSVQSRIADIYIIGERAKRARHSQVCSIENRGYIYLFYTSYSYNSISRYVYRGISAHIPRRDLVIFLSYLACV